MEKALQDASVIGKQFVTFYYDRFDNQRAELGSLYRDHSMLTFENSFTGGGANILEKLVNLPFQKVRHEVGTLDAQPSELQPSKTTPGEVATVGITVMVTGRLLVDEEQNPVNFSQSFNLKDEGNNSWYVNNDVFRLVYG